MSTTEQHHITETALRRHFDRRRIVFWYDKTGEMRDIFDQVNPEGVEKVEIKNNEFYLKHYMLKEKPNGQFLVYSPEPCPREEENWMLDLLLANEEFHADLSSIHLQDVGLPLEFKSLAEKHKGFFSTNERKSKLQKLIAETDRAEQIRLKMVAITCGTDADWDKVLYALIEESITGGSTKLTVLERYQLTDTLWLYLKEHHGYHTAMPTIKEWIILLFKDSFEVSIGQSACLTNEARLFVNRWKENVFARGSFQQWSKILEKELNIPNLLAKTAVEDILDADTYSVIDKAILTDLLRSIMTNTLPFHTLQEWMNQRKNRFFYEQYRSLYATLSYASQLMEEIRKADVKIASMSAGFKLYSERWYKIDRLYRNYILASQQSEHPEFLKSLSQEIDKMYSNTFLLPLGDNWQSVVNPTQKWEVDYQTIKQLNFYRSWVKPYTDKNNRIFVIISDALRYESAVELKERISAEDRFGTKITPTLGVLPSYTQMGMAAMLPHKKLTFDNQSDIVFVDGISSQGTANRTKILQQAYMPSIAISAEEFLAMKASTQGREFVKMYQVIYIYSNTIDKAGDDKASEHQVFKATEEEFDNLLRIVKQIDTMKGNNILITADHGYIYQQAKIEETDFTDFTPQGELYKTNRRFVIGRNLSTGLAVKKWEGKEIGLADDTEVLTANSISRIRVQGAGSRFVHGGCSLQEIVIPVLELSKSRKSEVEKVEVDVIAGGTHITGNIFPISFYQTKPVSENVLPRTLRATFYSQQGEQLSDSITFTFDSTDPESMKREKRHTFTFGSDASKYNKQEVCLRLEETIEGTTQLREYKTSNYRIMIAFSSEFDFD